MYAKTFHYSQPKHRTLHESPPPHKSLQHNHFIFLGLHSKEQFCPEYPSKTSCKNAQTGSVKPEWCNFVLAALGERKQIQATQAPTVQLSAFNFFKQQLAKKRLKVIYALPSTCTNVFHGKWFAMAFTKSGLRLNRLRQCIYITSQRCKRRIIGHLIKSESFLDLKREIM